MFLMISKVKMNSYLAKKYSPIDKETSRNRRDFLAHYVTV